jgi:glucans biosynthesis protein
MASSARPPRPDRRLLLAGATATAALAALGFPSEALAQQGLRLGEAESFAFEALKQRAREMASQPYQAPPSPRPDVLERIDYDAHGKIRFKPEMALWADGPSRPLLPEAG